MSADLWAQAFAQPARCYPERPRVECIECTRYRDGNPEPAEHRRLPIIDASLFRPSSGCAMRRVEMRRAA